MGIKIALAGNPNCGKTTMFNALTGANQYVGNWPGVTVEKKEGKLKGKRKNDNIVVTEGEFKGVHGRVARIAGQQRVIVELFDGCLVATAYVPKEAMKQCNKE
jgi:predicted GTPase